MACFVSLRDGALCLLARCGHLQPLSEPVIVRRLGDASFTEGPRVQKLPKTWSISKSRAKWKAIRCAVRNTRHTHSNIGEVPGPEPVTLKISFLPNKVNAYHPRTRELEAGRSGIQGHPQLCSKFRASHGYLDPVFNTKERSFPGKS